MRFAAPCVSHDVTKPSPHSDDPEQFSIISTLPPNQTSFEYLVSCWKRLNSQRSFLLRRGPTGSVSFMLSLNKRNELVLILGTGFGEIKRGIGKTTRSSDQLCWSHVARPNYVSTTEKWVIENYIRDLIISDHLCRKLLGASELLPSLLALSSTSSIFSNSATSDPTILLDPQSELQAFLTDVAKRFDKDGLEDVLGGVVRNVAFSPALAGGMVSYFAS
jgi:ubiquitin conjugation factor E4 B